MSDVSPPTIQAATMGTPLGPLTILAVSGIVRAGGFTEGLGDLVNRLTPELRATPLEVVPDLGPITERLEAYFAGDVSALNDLQVAQPGGAFQQRVWAALRDIEPGAPTTYRDLAASFGNPHLARAVGMGCATNAISPIVPCHRVTGSDGKLRGYYWALDRKRWLLDHERHHASTQ